MLCFFVIYWLVLVDKFDKHMSLILLLAVFALDIVKQESLGLPTFSIWNASENFIVLHYNVLYPTIDILRSMGILTTKKSGPKEFLVGTV